MKTIFKTGICLSVIFLGACNAPQAPIEKSPAKLDADAFSTVQISAPSDFESFDRLIGEWHTDMNTVGDDVAQWMTSQNISDFYVTFGWGSNKSWMNFDDFQVKNGKTLQTGKGFLAFDPGTQQIRFLEQGAEGAFIIGSMARTSPHRFERRIQVFREGGDVRDRTDILTFTPGDTQCMDWQTSVTIAGKLYVDPAAKMCRKAEP